MIVNWKHYPNS